MPGPFTRAVKRSLTQASSAADWNSLFPGISGKQTASGVKVNESTAKRLIAVLRCQTLISQGVSTLPIRVTRERSGGRIERVDPSRFEGWITQPNPYEGPIVFWNKVLLSLLNDGNAFIATIRDSEGFVTALYVLDPRCVTVDLEDINDITSERVYRYMGIEYDRTQILHIVGPYVHPDALRAMSPIDMAREAIGLGLAIEEYGARFFSQGTTMAGVIEHPGSPKPDEARLLREMFKKTHAGLKNSHAVGVLTGGAKWTSITITPEQAQFLDTRRFQNDQIAMLYGVPFHLVDPTVQSSWGSGVEEQNSWFLSQSLAPWVALIEEYVSTYLMEVARKMRFDMDARLRPKTKERYDAYAQGINNGWLCADDIRAAENMEPLPDGLGQKFYRPVNMAEVGKGPILGPNGGGVPAPVDNGGNEIGDGAEDPAD
jgi:HK97 family phage portal protein